MIVIREERVLPEPQVRFLEKVSGIIASKLLKIKRKLLMPALPDNCAAGWKLCL